LLIVAWQPKETGILVAIPPLAFEFYPFAAQRPKQVDRKCRRRLCHHRPLGPTACLSLLTRSSPLFVLLSYFRFDCKEISPLFSCRAANYRPSNQP
jgi:hypothetical protein